MEGLFYENITCRWWEDRTSGNKIFNSKFQIPLIVEEANNGKAWEYIERNNDIDILLTDVKMPHMDGLELAKKVNQLNPNIVIIIFSAYGEFDYAKKGMSGKCC